jgi:hypothetical protein
MAINGATLGVSPRGKTGWTLPEGELRSIGRAFHLALVEAGDVGAPLPSDEFLNAPLRERGCPDSQLAHWRDRIRQVRFAAAFESSAIEGQ